MNQTYGEHLCLLQDQGVVQRSSQDMGMLLVLVSTGSKRSRTTAYNPQSNSMVERFHRHLKSASKPNQTISMDGSWVFVLGLKRIVISTIRIVAA